MSKNDLVHALRMKFGLSPHEPTDAQLAGMLREIDSIARTRKPTTADWRAAAARQCPNFGLHKYAGLDLSDLNALLAKMKSQTSGRP